MSREKVHLVTLGCPKNRVDSEVMVGQIQDDDDFELTDDCGEADVAVVNTCGFNDESTQESIETIL
ncbi:MAG: 30S ribosomal protein S12 methylthiotransferase RimO, partial [Bradymonadaceae bacterium]